MGAKTISRSGGTVGVVGNEANYRVAEASCGVADVPAAPAGTFCWL